MQAITVAIGPAGISFFGQTLLASDLVGTLSRLAPPNRGIDAPDFKTTGAGFSDQYSRIHIDLSNGSFSGFAPVYHELAQQAGGKFQVGLSASNFNANYSWNETWHEYFCIYQKFGHCTNDDKRGGPFAYGPHFGGLDVKVVLGFRYDQPSNAYAVDVVSTNANASGIAPNVPAASVIQNEDQQCFSSHVSDATAGAVASIDFGRPIAALFGPLFKSIPASGHVTPDITYDFAVGDAGLTFPGDHGLAVGVTGAVTYKGEKYPGKPPAALPVPPVPTDANHLRTYVSSYEFDALNWAFARAGLLTYTVTPHDVPDADLLKTKTYASRISAFKQYGNSAMHAVVSPRQPPTTSFQMVWEFGAAAMADLKQRLPTTVYAKLGGVDGDNYVSQADLESDLTDAGVDQQWFATIERAAQVMGMVVKHDLQLKLVIEYGDAPQPEIVFDLVRTDVLQNLSLGESGGAQTLKFDFKRVAADAKLVSTTVPKFDKADFGDTIWPNVGEPAYDKLLTDIGTGTGVPLPIMQGFKFLFEHAQVSVQDGYVSVLAQVKFDRAASPLP
ncbi:MAG TPA: hypothetical protein VF529_14160 [Solirubrobacteraceae bacterium]|jgi:hypothetical protein